MQFTHNYIAKQMMIDICMTTIWGLDALMDRHPEQIRWRNLSKKLEDLFTYIAMRLEQDKIDDYQSKRFYINIWKHIGKLELDYFLRFEDIVQVFCKDSVKNKKRYKNWNGISEHDINTWENIGFIFSELSIEQDEMEIDLMKNSVSTANIEKVIEVVGQSSASKAINSIVNNIIPIFGFNLGYSKSQLKALYQALIDETFLDNQTNEDFFIHAFSGEELKKFDKLTWSKNKTNLSLFIGQLNDDNKWKIAENVFKNCDNRNLAKTFNNAQYLERHKLTIKIFRKILKR